MTRQHPRGWVEGPKQPVTPRAVSGVVSSASGLSLALSLSLALAFSAPDPSEPGDEGRAFVGGGTFVMGTSAADVPALKAHYELDFPGVFENETPSHPVTIGDFFLDRHEVSNDRFSEFLDASPQWRKSRLSDSLHNGDYLAHSLKAYRSGERNNVIMAGFSATLTDQDIYDLAAFYAAKEGLVDLKIK